MSKGNSLQKPGTKAPTMFNPRESLEEVAKVTNLPKVCTPGYQLSGGSAAFTAEHQTVINGARMQWRRLGRTADAARVQIVVTDVPDQMSALSLVRRT